MTPFRDLIVSTASRVAVAPNFVEAIVLQESGAKRWAYNPEPKYRYLWDVRRHRPFRALTHAEIASEAPPSDFPTLAGDRDQEWWSQQASWGLGQIMGAVARELGFMGEYLGEIFDPPINIRLASTHLAHLLTWSEGNVRKAAAAYNAGRGGWAGTDGQRYASHVAVLLEAVDAAHPPATVKEVP